MADYEYDLNYQYKDTTGRVSGGMTSQGTNYSDTGYSEYWYQKELLKTKRSEGNKELITSWDELK